MGSTLGRTATVHVSMNLVEVLLQQKLAKSYEDRKLLPSTHTKLYICCGVCLSTIAMAYVQFCACTWEKLSILITLGQFLLQ